MSHEVETMAYTNEVPWHGLGVSVEKAPDVKKMLKLAGLDWTVSKKPILAQVGDKKTVHIPDAFALMRDKDSKVLDVVGKQYTPVQNTEAFEFFKEFVEAGDATMETAGSLREGRYVWGLAKLGKSFKLKGNDQVNGYLLLASPHQQGKSMLMKTTGVRVVCMNTMSMALADKKGEHRHAHRTAFDKVAIAKAKEALGIARDQFEEFAENAKRLQAKTMTRTDALEVLAPIYQPDFNGNVEELMKDWDKLAAPRITLVMDALEKAPGAQPGNAWGVLNAVTYYSDHIASRSSDKRLSNAWMGKTSREKEKVYQALLAA